MTSRNHGINANVEILVIPVNLPVGNGNIPTLILWQQSIKIGLVPNGISFQMFKVLHIYAPRGYAFFVPLRVVRCLSFPPDRMRILYQKTLRKIAAAFSDLFRRFGNLRQVNSVAAYAFPP